MQKHLIVALFLVLQPWQSFALVETSANAAPILNCSSLTWMMKDDEHVMRKVIDLGYDNDINNFAAMLNFVHECPHILQASGYEAIFKVMQQNDDLWSSEGFQLAHAISHFDSDWALAIQFPETIYKLYFDSEPHCLLKNMEFNEYYYAADSYYGYDSRRRNNFCWTKKTTSQEAVYDVRPVATDVFTLRNTYYDEYLYVDEAQFAYSTERRRVFTFRQKPVRPVGSEWKFEPKKGAQNVVKVRNTKYNELLYADRDVMYDTNRREVFTERIKGHAEERWTLWSLEC